MRVRLIKNYEVSERFTAKKGKYGNFDDDLAKKMIKDGCAVEVRETAVTMADIAKIKKKPYIEPVKPLNPTALKQQEADKIPEPPVKSNKKTKEEKKF